MMERNGITHIAVKTYLDSYHGKNYRLGFPEKAAGCADCHTSHAILHPQDIKSSINPANLVKTCGKCHPKATITFTEYYPHAEMTNSEEYPVLYWTFILMTGLLLGTFTVFWIHTLLWLFRGFVENREKLAALHNGHIAHVVPDGHKQYRRFKMRHIIMHLSVIISFLGLSLTGLPLKFADQGWAHFMMTMFGGTANAGLIHRACAVLTFAYFISAIVMTIHFLFIRKDIKGNFLQRLFGPDSLCPNFRDVRDVVGMVKWFLFMGPKPTFERWTYWEKFDFIAVFWGMFAIGGSGLMLWFPEIFGVVLPGWAFNVATIVHSDEALLATGFIFTVHFFNTHGRPEKFPMDFVIFNGQMSKEEFIEERGDQWRRYEKEGITEQFAVKKPSGVFYDFILKGFGLLAFFTGVGCLILMILALTSGSGH
jgi:cytochrome b subunit of formate dehydrogenase